MSDLYDLLRDACSPGGQPSFIRIRARYLPVAGPGSVIAPPTYPGTKTSEKDAGPRYVLETRWFDGTPRRCVRIDSVGSQANRAESALDGLAEDQVEGGGGGVPIPRFIVHFEGRTLSSLQLSHRVHDAELVNTVTDEGEAFAVSAVGKAVLNATPDDAAALLRYAPEALAFGAWDSHGRGARARFPRAYESKMIGVAAGDVEPVPQAAVKVDLLNLNAPARTVQLDKASGEWSLMDKAVTGGVALSAVGLGCVPSVRDEAGGVAVECVERVAVLSFPTLRQLRFVPRGGAANANVAGRALVAAYALLGDRLAFAAPGLVLRSGCALERVDEHIEAVGGADLPGASVDEALIAYARAVDEARRQGLEVSEKDIDLRPSPALAKAWARTSAMVGEEAGAG